MEHNEQIIQLLQQQNEKMDIIISLLQGNSPASAAVFQSQCSNAATSLPSVMLPKTTTTKKKQEKKINPDTVRFLAEYLKRPDIPNFFKNVH